MMRALRVLAPALLAIATIGAAAHSTTTMNGYQIETSSNTFNLNTYDIKWPNEVKITRPGSDARGDHGDGNTKRGTVNLIGHVVIHDNGNAPEVRQAGAAPGDSSGPSTLTCDVLAIDTKARVYDARGTVKFVQGDRLMTADHARLDQITHTLHLDGNVLLAQGEASTKADNVDYNLATREALITGQPTITRIPVPPNNAAPAAPSTPKPKKKH